MSVSIHAKAKGMVIYEAPTTQPAYALWRAKMWWETTFAFAVMDPFEKAVFYGLTFTILLAVLTGMVRILPGQLLALQQRTAFYIFGDELGVKAAFIH